MYIAQSRVCDCDNLSWFDILRFQNSKTNFGMEPFYATRCKVLGPRGSSDKEDTFCGCILGKRAKDPQKEETCTFCLLK
jgi:hypothetical protein